MTHFDFEKIPSQKGRLAIVTGANIGLGFETALYLAQKEMQVILACRNAQKAEEAKQEIIRQVPKAQVICMSLDLSRLASVRAFAQQFQTNYSQLDLLINNAGIMMPPYQKTEDGFESQMGTNYWGHFLLTALLLPILEKTKASRIVTLSSVAHKWGDIYFDNLHFERNYVPQKAYGQSKLACLMFAYEMQRRLTKHKSPVLSLAAHPGISTTNLGQYMPFKAVFSVLSSLFFQSAKHGAEPTLRAALDTQLKGGEFLGPDGFLQYRGKAVLVKSNAVSYDLTKAQKLWEVSEKMTGIRFLS
jgi:NAD(P)-dependent dehydrogenase (short-subunit alcohol dehydrogenase family)